MPAEVISTIHHLEMACKNKGIVFVDKYGNIINNTNELDTATDETGPYNNNLEITEVDENDMETDRPKRTGSSQEWKPTLQNISQKCKTISPQTTTT